MKSKKNKSRSSRGGGFSEWLKGIFSSSNSNEPNKQKSAFSLWPFSSDKSSDQQSSLSIGTLQIPQAPSVPVGQPIIPGRPMAAPAPAPAPDAGGQSGSVQGGRRRRRTYKNKHRK
jgi:hypothetical protein